MASRPIWRGHLRLALVSCPVAMYSARHDRGAIRFNMLNPKTGNRIKMVTQDGETGEPLSRGDTVKGYEFEKNRYVIVSEGDIEGVRVESSSMMRIEKFVEASSIDPIYFDASYYLAPDGKGSEDVYAVLREAVGRTGKVALTRVVISQRERTVAIRPFGKGLVAQTLHEERDLNDAGELFDRLADVGLDPEMVALAVQLVDRQTDAYDPADLEDQYETRLRAMLDAKVKGEEAVSPTPAAPYGGNVVDLRAALLQSLRGSASAAPAAPAGKRRLKAQTPEEARRQPALKLPIAGGKRTKEQAVAPASAAETVAATRPRRKAG